MNLTSTTLAGKFLRLPLRCIPKDATMFICSGPLRGARWVAGASAHGCWLGWYERAKVRQFVKSLRADAIVYDIGANAGYYTLVAAKYCAAGRVFAFEPLPANAAILRRHVAMNHIANVTLLEVAVSNRQGEGRFQIESSQSMGHLDAYGNLPVREMTIDAMIRRGETVDPDVIKIDIEGGEYDALQGAIGLLTRKKPTLFLATHGAEVHARCCEMLREIGYVLASVDGLPVEKTSELIAV